MKTSSTKSAKNRLIFKHTLKFKMCISLLFLDQSHQNFAWWLIMTSFIFLLFTCIINSKYFSCFWQFFKFFIRHLGKNGSNRKLDLNVYIFLIIMSQAVFGWNLVLIGQRAQYGYFCAQIDRTISSLRRQSVYENPKPIFKSPKNILTNNVNNRTVSVLI